MIDIELSHLFYLQKKLDDHIYAEKGLNGADLIHKKSLALIVEIGELANEWRGFKYWSAKKSIAREKMLEEYVDCLHFLLSIGLENPRNMFQSFHANNASDQDIVDQFIDLFGLVYHLSEASDHYNRTMYAFITLGFSLGLSWEEVELAYVRKNKINHQRQASGY